MAKNFQNSGRALGSDQAGPPMQLPGATLPMQAGQDFNAPYVYPPTPPVNPFRGATASAPSSPVNPYRRVLAAQTAAPGLAGAPLPPPRPAGLDGLPSPVDGMTGMIGMNPGTARSAGPPIYTAANLDWFKRLFGGGNA